MGKELSGSIQGLLIKLVGVVREIQTKVGLLVAWLVGKVGLGRNYGEVKEAWKTTLKPLFHS